MWDVLDKEVITLGMAVEQVMVVVVIMVEVVMVKPLLILVCLAELWMCCQFYKTQNDSGIMDIHHNRTCKYRSLPHSPPPPTTAP